MSSIDKTIIKSTSNWKMLRAMVGIGLLCAFFIVMTFETTFERIANNKAEALEKAIFKVVPNIESKQEFTWNDSGEFSIADAENQGDTKIFAGYNGENELTGFAIEASGMGFADILRILYGYDPESGKIVGFYVLESKETPGLGDKIEKDEDFLSNFIAMDASLDSDGKGLKNKIVTVKKGAKENEWEIDGITGATISSRAIGDIIGASSEIWIPRIAQKVSQFENTSIKKEIVE